MARAAPENVLLPVQPRQSATDAQENAHVILIAHLPPVEGPASVHAARLLHRLVSDGAKVLTFSTHPHSAAAHVLSFDTKAGLRPLSSTLLAESRRVILYANSLPFRTRNIVRLIHAIRLLWRLFRLSRRVDLICHAGTARILNFGFRHAGLTGIVAIPGNRPALKIANDSDHLANPDISADAATDFSIDHGLAANPGRLRVTPALLRHALKMPHDPAVTADMNLVLAAVSLPGLAACAQQALTRHQSPAQLPGFLPCSTDSRLTRLESHLHAALRLSGRFRLRTSRDINKYRHWLSQQTRFLPPNADSCPIPVLDPAKPADRLAMDFLDWIRNRAMPQGLEVRIGGGSTNLTRKELLLALVFRAPAVTAIGLRRPWQDQNLRQWLHAEFDAILFKSHRRPAGKVDLTGLADSSTGLGQNFWMSVSAFAQIGIPTHLLQADSRFDLVDLANVAAMKDRPTRHLARPVALHHLNADRIPQALIHRRFTRQPDTFHIGFLLWELDRLPQSHLLACDMLDEIWVPSDFLNAIYSAHARCPVRTMLKGIDLPEPVGFDRTECGILPTETMFLAVFDANSSVERKNPLAAARAFQTAFPKSATGYRLVIKSTCLKKPHWGDPNRQMQSLRAMSARDRRIVLIERDWSFQRLLGLVAACDALVSPHRAEGFGYMPAYALKLGRPVIATDYSGSQQYLDAESGYPVANKLVPVPDNLSGLAAHGAQWAEPDHDHLVETLRFVATNKASAAGRAAAGRHRIETIFSRSAQGRRYLSRFLELDLLTDARLLQPSALDQMFTNCS